MRTTHSFFRLSLSTLFTLVSGALTSGQIIAVTNSVSTPIPGAGHDYIRLLSETVDPANGSLSIRLQAPAPPGRRLTVRFSFAYDSNGVEFPIPLNAAPGYSTWGTAKTDAGPGLVSGGWSYSVPLLTYVSLIQPIQPDTVCTTETGFVLQDPTGGRHSLNVAHIGNTSNICTGAPLDQQEKDSGGDDYYQATLQSGLGPSVIDSHGTVYVFPSIGMAGNGAITAELPTSIEDTNGNVVRFSAGNNSAFTETDDLGRPIISASGFGQTGNTVTVSGQLNPYTITWGLTSLNFTTPNYNNNPQTTGCHRFSASESGGGVPAITNITQPNGQQFKFTYEGTFGLPSQITYPSGGYVKYTWGFNQYSAIATFPADNPIVPTPQCQFVYSKPAVTDRYVSFDGSTLALHQHFTYVTNWNTQAPGYWTTKQTVVTTTDLIRNVSYTTTYTYSPIPGPNVPNEPPQTDNQIPVESTIVYQDNNGATLRTVTKFWGDQYELLSEQTTLDNNLFSEVVYSYGPGAQVTEKDEYDFGSASRGPLLRKTLTSYQQYPFGASIFDRPCQVLAYDGSGNRVAETDYLYDGGASVCGAAGTATTAAVTNLPAGTHDENAYSASSTAPRGNATTVTRKCLQTCSNGVTTFTYDETGQVVTSKDANGNITNYSYADNFDSNPSSNTNAYVTQITRPPANSVSHIEKFKYAYSDGQLIQSTDENNQVTSYLYADSFRRPTETDYADGGKTTFSYNDSSYNPSTPSPSVTTTRAMTSTTNVTSLAAFDGLGHTVRSVLTSDPSCASGDRTDTTYDGLGLPYTSSNPYCTTSDPTYGLTTYTYDALGRTTQVSRQDGSIARVSYASNCTTVTDEAGKLRRSCTDGLGRLIEVDEPAGTGGATAGSGTITIGGGPDQSTTVTYVCGPNGQTCQRTVYDGGSINVTVNNFTASATFWQPSTPGTIATSLASALNAGGSPVAASSNGAAVTMTANTPGSASNYPVSVSVSYDSQDFSHASFTASGPSTLTGGTDDSLTNPAFTLYAYDALGNLTCAVQKGTDPTAFTTCAAAPAAWRPRSFAYDSLSRLTSSINPESNTVPSTGATLATTYSYDANGNLASKTSPAPNQTGATTVILSYCYDALNRITSKAYTAQSCPMTSPVASYSYDQSSYNGLTITNGIGRRTGMSDTPGAEAWSYDSMGRVLTDRRTTNGVTKSTTYAYLPYVDDSVNTITYPSGRVMTYSTGTAERLLSVLDNSTSVYYAAAATYAATGALSSVTNNTNIVSTFFYNSRLQPCRISVKNTGTAPSKCADTTNKGNVLDFGYGFNFGSADNGNVAFITNNRDNTRSQNFAYDSLNRISTAQTQTSGVTIPNANCWGLTFGYDPWGNLLTSSISGPAGCSEPMSLNVAVTTSNRISTNTVAGVVTNYCYDAAGNLIHSVTAPATCPTSGPYQYTYNAENQLTATAGMTYTYDGDGKRAQKSTGKLYWYGIGSDPLDETDAQGNTNNASFNEYVFFGGKRIASRNYQNNVSYYFADHLGTARVVTNSSGTMPPLDDSDFYPFGGERPIVTSSGNTYKFTGKERDGESGLDNFGARYDSSSMGRFMSPDPLGGRMIDPQTLNKYSYTRNNPVNLIDPTGLYTCADQADCKSKQDIAFEKARQQDLKSKDPNVVRAAESYGDPTKDNGVGVQFGDPGKGKNGNTTSDVRVDPNDPSKVQASETVTIRPGQSSTDLAATVGHEGSHVADAQDFVSTLTTAGAGDQSKNLTKYATELKAYLVTQSILAALASPNEKRSFGDCGGPCILGPGILPAQALQTINQLLANPKNGYGVTPDKPGPVMYPNLTTPK